MKQLAKTRSLLRLAVRRDRLVLPATIGLLLLIVIGSARALVSTYSSQQAIVDYISAAAASGAGRIFQGPIPGASIGSILVAETFLTAAVIMSIMSIFIITRHTRHNEETGAAELLGAGAVGRQSPLTAAFLLAIGANLLAGLLIFAGLASMAAFDALGSAYFAGSLVAFSLLMAAIGGLTAQLSSSRRGSNLGALAVLGGFFLVRGLGDALGQSAADGLSANSHWLSWLSPMGWSFQVLPFSANQVWPLLAILAAGAISAAGAYFLRSKRDLGGSLIGQRPGPAQAMPSLLRPSGLARRLQRGGILTWALAAAAAGGLTAVIVHDFQKTLADNEVLAEWFTQGGGGTAAAVAIMASVLAAMLAGCGVAAISKMQDEEASGRLEHLLSSGLSRARWFLGHLRIAFGGNLITLTAMGTAASLGYFLAAGAERDIGILDPLGAALVNLPAMLLFTSVVGLAFAGGGGLTKPLAWAFYGYCALISSLAGIFSWPAWSRYLSPFSHSPLYPAESFSWAPLMIMACLAIIVGLIAAHLFARRDLTLR